MWGMQKDAIACTLRYASSITPDSGPMPDPGNFGQTHYRFAADGGSITHRDGSPGGAGVPPTPATYDVNGTIKNTLTYQVTNLGHTDIRSDSDPAITQDNYQQVVKDLTPLTAAQGTRFKNEPPRDKFWAEDLTRKHELFHCDEDVRFGGPAVTAGQDWANTQTANNTTQLDNVLAGIMPKIEAAFLRARNAPSDEQRAYDNGAPEYSAQPRGMQKATFLPLLRPLNLLRNSRKLPRPLARSGAACSRAATAQSTGHASSRSPAAAEAGSGPRNAIAVKDRSSRGTKKEMGLAKKKAARTVRFELPINYFLKPKS